MKYSYSYRTDKGNTRKINQDALLIKTSRMKNGDALLLAVFDGLGGMDQGEKMSQTAASMVSQWFDYEFSMVAETEEPETVILSRLRQLLDNINSHLFYENSKASMSGGTTISMLLLWRGLRFVAHVGDSRIYEIDENGVKQLTKDHSWVAHEVALGHMTEREAEESNRKNVILQCLGPREELDSPQLTCKEGTVPATYVLCTDGFWHFSSPKQMMYYFSPATINVEQIDDQLERMISEYIDQGEKDNITAIVVYVS